MGVFDNMSEEIGGGNLYNEYEIVYGDGIGSLLMSAAKFILPQIGKIAPTIVGSIVPTVSGIIGDKMKANQEAIKQQKDLDMKIQLLREQRDPETTMQKRLQNEKLRLELEQKYPGMVKI